MTNNKSLKKGDLVTPCFSAWGKVPESDYFKMYNNKVGVCLTDQHNKPDGIKVFWLNGTPEIWKNNNTDLKNQTIVSGVFLKRIENE